MVEVRAQRSRRTLGALWTAECAGGGARGMGCWGAACCMLLRCVIVTASDTDTPAWKLKLAHRRTSSHTTGPVVGLALWRLRRRGRAASMNNVLLQAAKIRRQHLLGVRCQQSTPSVSKSVVDALVVRALVVVNLTILCGALQVILEYHAGEMRGSPSPSYVQESSEHHITSSSRGVRHNVLREDARPTMGCRVHNTLRPTWPYERLREPFTRT